MKFEEFTIESNILPFGVACACVVDACWFEDERIGKSTVFMPPLRMKELYNLSIEDGISGIEAAVKAKLLSRCAEPGYYILRHKRLNEVLDRKGQSK